jgi:hypothetical protein
MPTDRHTLTAKQIDEQRYKHEQHVHASFGLSYASYLVVARSVLEAMPYEWQEEFVKLMDELNDRYDTSNFEYTVHRRLKGRFVSDPLRDYRHTSAQNVAGVIDKHSHA